MIKAANSAHFQQNDPHIFVLPPPSFFHDDIDVVQTSSRSYYGILYHIYSTKSAKYLHNICRFDAAMNYRCPGCYKIEDFIYYHIYLMHQADIYLLLCTL